MEVAPSASLRVGGSVGLSSPPCALWLTSVHISPLWVSLGIGGRMFLCVLVCVTLNLSLHVFVSQPLPWICVQEACPWEGL